MIVEFNRVTNAIIKALSKTLNNKKSSDLFLTFNSHIQKELDLKEGDTCLIYALCHALDGDHEQAMQDVKDYIAFSKLDKGSK